jgi:hypothetical protein
MKGPTEGLGRRQEAIAIAVTRPNRTGASQPTEANPGDIPMPAVTNATSRIPAARVRRLDAVPVRRGRRADAFSSRAGDALGWRMRFCATAG